MAFSLATIFIMTLSLFIAKDFCRSRDYYLIEFDVTGMNVSKNRNNVKTVKRAIYEQLNLDDTLVQFERPTHIKNGLKMHINLYVNNSTATDSHPEKIMTNAHDSGKLQKIIKGAWKLSKDPVISNFQTRNSMVEMRPLSTNMSTQSLGGPAMSRPTSINEPGRSTDTENAFPINLPQSPQPVNTHSVVSMSTSNVMSSKEEIVYVDEDGNMEGYLAKQTKLESAVHLDIIKAANDQKNNDHNETDVNEMDSEDDHDIEPEDMMETDNGMKGKKRKQTAKGNDDDLKEADQGVNESENVTEALKEIDDGIKERKRKQTDKGDEVDNENEDKGNIEEEHVEEDESQESAKHDVLLDGMLSDVLRMQSIDPNKIHQLSMKQVDDNKNESDTDNSDDIYEESNDNEQDQDEEDTSVDLSFSDENEDQNEQEEEHSNEKQETDKLITKGDETYHE